MTRKQAECSDFGNITLIEKRSREARQWPAIKDKQADLKLCAQKPRAAMDGCTLGIGSDEHWHSSQPHRRILARTSDESPAIRRQTARCSDVHRSAVHPRGGHGAGQLSPGSSRSIRRPLADLAVGIEVRYELG